MKRSYSFLHRAIAAVLVPAQVFLGAPLMAADSRPAAPKGPEVKVRKPMKVEPPRPDLRFSTQPTDDEIFRARVFEEPLVALGEPGPSAENAALAEALLQFRRRQDPDDVSALSGFLEAHPASRWRASVLTNLGLAYRWSGRFPQALEAWEEAWRLSRQDETAKGRALADRALGELAAMNGRLGRYERLEALLEEVKERDVINARDRLIAAREGFWMMKNKPQVAFRCGPLSLSRILAAKGLPEFNRKIAAAKSTRDGMSLAQVADLAADIDLNYRMAFREDGDIPLPSMVHWKAGHYAAVVRMDESKRRYLIQDPTFGQDLWVSPKVLDEEASGYFLIPESALGTGWREVGKEEAANVWGKGHINGRDQAATHSCDDKVRGDCSNNGAAGYNVHSMLVSLNITDTPLSYRPPFGPPVNFRITYNHKEAFQPGVFSYSNLGASWTFDWLSYVNDDPATFERDLTLYARGGGTLTFPRGVNESGADPLTHATIARAKATDFDPSYPADDPAYVVSYPDGSEDVYYQSDYATSYPRKIFLKEIRDPQGHTLKLKYDEKLRVVELLDALGQPTTLSYDLPGDDLKVTRVTDPFGRSARLEYSGGRLMKIIDVIGLSSSFTYGSENFVQSLRTPYGTSRFSRSGASLENEWIEAVDPMGGRERVEWRLHLYHEGHHHIPALAESEDSVPAAFGCLNCGNEESGYGSNTFYWDKQAMATAPGDHTKAQNTRWATSYTIAGRVKWSDKKPLENRVYYFYPGQAGPMNAGTSHLPNRISRVVNVEGGRKVEQTHLYEYSAKGQVTRYTDPAGRTTIYKYDSPDGTDLREMLQTNGQSVEVLARYQYNERHQPLAYTDSAGKTTRFTYNHRHQLETASHTVEGRTDTWTLTYDTAGYLQSVQGPRPGATLGLTWDGYGRPRTLTNADSYSVTLDYDLMDRPLKVTYPNGTYEEVVWDRLHPSKYRDLAGRWAYVFVDGLRRPTGIKDSLGRLTSLYWCDCGGLSRLVDANGKATSWTRDVQGRITHELLANGSTVKTIYEPTTSRIARQEDPRGATKYTYNVDDTISAIDYLTPAGQVRSDTPGLTFTYDTAYRRLRTRTDGTGTTTYGYNPMSGAIGAGRVATVTGPLPDSTIQYGYDELGRVTSRSINGSTLSTTFDPLGRLATVTSALGGFTYNYDGDTGRLLSVIGPNGFQRTYGYFDIAGDRQLKEVTNKVGTTTLSRFSYTYLPTNEIVTWTQEQGGPAKRYELRYDAADQLTSATLRDVGSNQILKRYSYAYDAGQNRVSEQVDDLLTTSAHDDVNQLTSQTAGGSLRVVGHTNEPANVTIQGRPAINPSSNQFEGTVLVGSGPTSIVVTATDARGNTATKNVDVSTTGGVRTLTYDTNGNLTSDGSRTLEWDGRDRLLAVSQGDRRSEFSYDGFGRRVRIVEKQAGGIIADRRFLWCGTQICEERDATGRNVVKRFFSQGVRHGGTNLYYAKDHLGSVREVVDDAGVVRARYEYDPFGRRAKLPGGDVEADFGYTGYFEHNGSGLKLPFHRAYDSNLGRWTSRDPIGLAGGINQYAYVANDPINFVDPMGLSMETFLEGFIPGLTISIGVASAMVFASPVVVGTALAGGSLLLFTLAIEMYYADQAGTLCIGEADRVLGSILGGVIGGFIGGGIGGAARATNPAPKGMNNPVTRNAANMGNKVHYDKMNGGKGRALPTELAETYPETEFRFARRGESGADVEVVGGRHPSDYPDSVWDSANDFGDFKPDTQSGRRTFANDIKKSKLPKHTQCLLYDPRNGNPKW